MRGSIAKSRDGIVTVDFESLRLIDVSRTFGRRRALNRVSLVAEAGTITALLGHNGAGKSTLLKILSRITKPTRGEVHLRGRTQRCSKDQHSRVMANAHGVVVNCSAARRA